jgi:hypothetical protein
MRSVVGKLDGRSAAVKNATLGRGRQVISWRLSAVLALAVMSMAHVGSPDTFFVGDAGPYRVRVITRLPGVIPGRGQVSVRVLGAATGPPPRVTVRAGQWNVGVDGAPPPETAVAVPGDPELFATELWFMTPSSYALYVNVVGARSMMSSSGASPATVGLPPTASGGPLTYHAFCQSSNVLGRGDAPRALLAW